MRQGSPLKLCLFGICLLPGATLLVAGALRPRSPTDHHRHVWRAYRPPGGVLCLVDARGHPITHLAPGQLAHIECLPGVDLDRCALPEADCAYGFEGVVVESGGPRVRELQDGDAGGEFGALGPGGRFRALPPKERPFATHYRASGSRWGTFGFTATFDDTALTRNPPSDAVATYDDPPQESDPQWIVIGPPLR
jgi:hypothetical protein